MSQFNKESNAYIWIFAIVMTLVLGSILSFASQKLKPIQDAQVALEQKKFILTASMGADKVSEAVAAEGKEWINTTYDSKVKSFVVNTEGEVQEGMTVDQVSIAKEYKKPKEERMLPVYTLNNGETVEAYVFPLAGFGLWDRIWGFVALKSDLNTVQGAVYDHVGETPGLGARITSSDVQGRYVDKTVYADNGDLIGVLMQKGEGINYDNDPHKVDGMSGATLTAVGLNNMYVEYFGLYNGYIQKIKKENNVE